MIGVNFPAVMFIHFIADFIFQSDWMARNKSKSNKALGVHILVYSIPFTIIVGLKFGLVNGAIHFIIDYITSRITSRLWQRGEVHNFFVVIGLDQYLHFLTLWCTYNWMVK